MKTILTLLCCTYFFAVCAQNGNDFKPFPGDSAEMYKFDLYKNYFINDDEEYKDRVRLIAAVTDLDTRLMKAAKSGENVYLLISELDSLQKRIGRHSIYIGMFAYIDLANPVHYQKMDSFDRTLSPILGRINETIRGLPASSIMRKEKTGPDYTFFHTQSQNNPMRDLTANERKIITELTPGLINWQPSLFLSTMRSTEFKSIQTKDGTLSLPANMNQIFNNTDRAIRKEGFLNNLAGLKSRRDIYATLLLQTVRNRNKLATLTGFKDHPTQYYADRFLTKEEVTALLKTLKENAHINKRYERTLFENIKKAGNIDTVFAWDRSQPDPKAPTPRFTITEATRIILEATKPFGKEYAVEMSKLLDPRNGRLDMVNRPNRIQRPGFSSGTVGYNSVFFQGNYEGYMSDVIIFGHEAGHAVQNMLMDKNNVSSFYALGPGYFTESFAGFNELLITDYLYQQASSKELKKYYLSQFLNQSTEIFSTGMAAMYEQILYDSIPAGKINNADDLEKQMQKTGLEFSIWFEPHINYEMQWVNRMQFTTNPMYQINYVYSKLLALYYYSLYQQDGKSFIEKYNELLKNGYDQEPEKLLNKIFNARLGDKKMVAISLQVISKKIEEYEALME